MVWARTKRVVKAVGGRVQHIAATRLIETADRFCEETPSPATMVGIFSGEWSSQLPPPYENLSGGKVGLFDDSRIHWAAQQFGDLSGLRVLELGPLEGGHTFMLDRMGVAEVLAIEGNRRAFLRCLVTKELLGMPKARFVCGDFVEFLRQALADRAPRWDLCLAVGVLYHQQDPVALLDLATRASDRLLLWTHYYDRSIVSGRDDLAVRMKTETRATTAGFPHTLHHYEYQAALEWDGFCGGLKPWASWLARQDILDAIDHLGFEVVGIQFDAPNHPNGPAFCVAARRHAPATS